MVDIPKPKKTEDFNRTDWLPDVLTGKGAGYTLSIGGCVDTGKSFNAYAHTHKPKSEHWTPNVICFSHVRCNKKGWQNYWQEHYPSETMLHEAAHANTGGMGHNERWRREFSRLLTKFGYRAPWIGDNRGMKYGGGPDVTVSRKVVAKWKETWLARRNGEPSPAGITS